MIAMLLNSRTPIADSLIERPSGWEDIYDLLGTRNTWPRHFRAAGPRSPQFVLLTADEYESRRRPFNRLVGPYTLNGPGLIARYRDGDADISDLTYGDIEALIHMNRTRVPGPSFGWRFVLPHARRRETVAHA